jgi:hypothetical protein
LKKFIAIAIAIIAILAMTVPAMADNSSTSVDIQTGTGGAPYVVAKWETPDDDPATIGTQILPPLVKNAIKDVKYYALVDDPQGDSNVSHVYVDVWHPTNSPAPYDANNYHKYQLELSRPTDPNFEEYITKIKFQAAWAAGIVVVGINPATSLPFTKTQIEELIDQQSVGKWWVKGWIDYEQPAGTYSVQIRGVDAQNNVGTLDNTFYYIPVSMVEFDFGSFSYGQAFPGVHQEIDGDRNFAEPDQPAGNAPLNGATVRNIGNVWSRVTVQNTDLFQNGLALGKTGSEWNVEFDARMGDPPQNANITYYPGQLITLPSILTLSNLDKLDFSILIKKFGISGTWTGTMALGSVIAEPEWPTTLN